MKTSSIMLTFLILFHATALGETPEIAVPAGTKIFLAMVTPFDSKRTGETEEYAAVVKNDVVLDGLTVIPANASAYLNLIVRTKPALLKPSTAVVRLVALKVNGKRYELTGTAAPGAILGPSIVTTCCWLPCPQNIYADFTGRFKIPAGYIFTYAPSRPALFTYAGGSL
jgi:hypothetical protein